MYCGHISISFVFVFLLFFFSYFFFFFFFGGGGGGGVVFLQAFKWVSSHLSLHANI